MLPAFSYFFGIQPWEVGDLTFDEIAEYQRQLAQLNKRSTKAR